MKLKGSTLIHGAPGLLGAFSFRRSLALSLALGLALPLVSCREKDQGGDWSGQKGSSARVAQAPAPAPSPTPAPAVPADLAPAVAVPKGTAVRFVAYNVENWLTMERTEDGKRIAAPKPEKERAAVTKVLVAAQPDILGVSEIGNEDDVKDLQKHLADAGWPLPNAHIHHGADPTRSLVLLSKYPITQPVVRKNLTYRLQGAELYMQRGILDATVDSPVGPFRCVGVHLKSKREVEDGDEEEMRRNEAHLLRREVEAILTQDPQARLVVYGDFNDTRNSPSIRAIQGSGRDAQALSTLPLKDSRGHYWTHHWDYQDVYSRFDYVMLSPALKDAVDRDKSRIIDDGDVASASDHRPLLVILKK